jgi:CubicO group peptidase (beta-lactamase class C family)
VILLPLPVQPAGVSWPTEGWPEGIGVSRPALDLLDAMFADVERYATTYAVVIIRSGELVYERYENALPNWTGPDIEVGCDTPLLSWSMAKSITHAAVGLLIGDGRLNIRDPAPIASWSGDERASITLDDLLCMRDGLDFVEDYVADPLSGDGRSDVIEMLFGPGSDDVAAYATSRPRLHPPGAVFNYSSGTSNIVSRVVGDTVGGGEAEMRSFLDDRLFRPVGMRSATPRFDASGTFVGSSYVHATARDFAKFGLLYLRDGVWDGRRILPEGWVDHARTLRSIDAENGRPYGAHWWVVDDEHGSFWASGYEGQMIVCVPDRDVVIVRLGRTDAGRGPNLYQWRADLTEALA